MDFSRDLLHTAAESGDVDKVRELLEQYTNMDCEDPETGKTPLHYACERGHEAVVRELVSHKASLSKRDYNGHYPFHYACQGGHLSVINVLASEFKADLTTLDGYDRTAIMLAARGGHDDLVLTLLHDCHCPVSGKDLDGWAVLHHACAGGSVNIVQTLICEHKADVDVRNEFNETPLHVSANTEVVRYMVNIIGCNPNAKALWGCTLLHYACKSGAMDIAVALVRDCNADVNVHDEHGDMPLHVAAQAGHYQIALALVSEFGCDPNAVGSQGYTLLHYACKNGAKDIVCALIRDCKADVDVCDKRKDTPLHIAVKSGHYEIALALVSEFGCDPNTVFSKGYTLLHYACRKGAMDIVRALIRDCKADVNVHDDHEDTPLHVASRAGHHEIVLALVSEFGCNLNALFSRGYTLLHYACKSGAMNIVRTLICDNKANVNARDEYNYTPLHVAAEAGHYEIALALVSEFGCDPNACNSLGRTALHMASLLGHSITVQTLLKFTSPLLTDRYGNTPLHLAARNNRVDCVYYLVYANTLQDPRDDLGQTPADVACGESKTLITMYIDHSKLRVDYFKVVMHAYMKYFGSHHITRVFVLGNPGAGKSSFIESLKREGFFSSLRKVSESSVPPHTAGIIPSVHMSKDYGRVQFYDFAGDVVYYSSHAAIFESLAASRNGDSIFIVVVDLREDSATIKTTLHYWVSFIQYQKFKNPSLIVVGSHVDLSTKHSDKGKLLDHFCSTIECRAKHFMLDCRDPRSNQIAHFKNQILTWVSESPKYKISLYAWLLLGLLQKNFSAVTACSVQTLVSHISDCGLWLPVASKPLHELLWELHEVGVLLLLGDYTKDYYHVILNISKLTNEVHELLFSESAVSNIKNAHASFNTAPLNIGIVPEALLADILPPYITKECLIHLQYCQPISHNDVGFFPSLEQNADTSSQSFLFFPALCSVDKGQVFWEESTMNSFSVGWLALCTDPHDYFPPRFLHVLLLRLVYAFTLSPEPVDPQTAHASRRCTMWKKGVLWSMEEGVDCMVELVEGCKRVVVLSRSSPAVSEECIGVFTKIVICVMEAKAEFCHSIKPKFFLLDSTVEADYLNEDHQFPVRDVERALAEGKPVAVSMGRGRGKMELSKLQCMRKFTHWHSFFPIEYKDVLHTLQVVVNKLDILGLCLGTPSEFLEKLHVNFPSDVDQRRIELIKWWMSSSQVTPCWWYLVQALSTDTVDEKALADKITRDYSVHIHLQEKLLNQKSQVLKLDEEFLCSFSDVVGSRWPSLAVSLSLSEGEIEGLKGKVGISQQKLALQMLKIWASWEEATYGQLYRKLNTISLFQYST